MGGHGMDRQLVRMTADRLLAQPTPSVEDRFLALTARS